MRIAALGSSLLVRRVEVSSVDPLSASARARIELVGVLMGVLCLRTRSRVLVTRSCARASESVAPIEAVESTVCGGTSDKALAIDSQLVRFHCPSVTSVHPGAHPLSEGGGGGCTDVPRLRFHGIEEKRRLTSMLFSAGEAPGSAPDTLPRVPYGFSPFITREDACRATCIILRTGEGTLRSTETEGLSPSFPDMKVGSTM